MSYPAAERISGREWLALGAILFGFALSVALVAGLICSGVVLVLRVLKGGG